MFPSIIFALVVFNGVPQDPATEWELRGYRTKAECMSVARNNRKDIGLKINPHICGKMNLKDAVLIREQAPKWKEKVWQ